MISPMKLERIKKEITQIDLWMMTRIPQWRISLIERGVPATPEEMKKIVSALGVPEQDLFPESEKLTRKPAKFR